MWIAVLLTAVVLGWWIYSKNANKKATKGPAFTVKIETTSSASDRERTPEEEAAYQQAKTIDWDNRVKNSARWSGDTTIPLPIKQLTVSQYYCLRDATMKFRIRAESDVVEDTGYIRSIKHHPTKTINSLVKHGMIAASDDGYFMVTNLGCRAFEQLPTRYS